MQTNLNKYKNDKREAIKDKTNRKKHVTMDAYGHSK